MSKLKLEQVTRSYINTKIQKLIKLIILGPKSPVILLLVLIEHGLKVLILCSGDWSGV